jgi:hypothetical protein|tara:strand:- start:235 stop:507 length:273 start_codon:yes stop_codon:yes gene_type:complete
MGYTKRYCKRHSQAKNWRIIKRIDGFSEATYKIQNRKWFGLWITERGGRANCVRWFQIYDDAKEVIELMIENHKEDLIRMNVITEVINFE